MTITATFSNGYEETYKGNRAVKAAWAVIRKSDGKVIASGHSLDRAKAAKTAQGAMSEKAHGFGPLRPTRAYPGWEKPLRRHGYDGPKATAAMTRWAREQNAERLARIAAAHTIEIIDL
ncbi:hypothetical protein [Roseovarius sp. SYSU LYC5161]|uniref:hypothetical protein n=1 Tax=Roseovarius halophilus (ex Wu et al. 2025) TaxID=3376060 RepID=UPI00399B33B7